MEEPFLLQDEHLVPCKATWKSGQVTVELKKVSSLAAPMAAVTIAQYLLPVISVMVAGHNGELQLSGVALATSFTNVSGFSILVMICYNYSLLLSSRSSCLSNLDNTILILCAVWVSGCTRNSLWPSLWSQTIRKNRNLHILCNCL